jgi:ABC-type sugar transport system permease subunit
VGSGRLCSRGGGAGPYGRLVRPSSRVAFTISWLVFAVAVVLAWRKVLAAPNGDISRLLVATVAGGLGLTLLGAWLQDHERDR